jgi:hypothetical protein
MPGKRMSLTVFVADNMCYGFNRLTLSTIAIFFFKCDVISLCFSADKVYRCNRIMFSITSLVYYLR